MNNTYVGDQNRQVHSKFKFNLRHLIVPETWHYWGCGDIQKIVMVYQWMIRSALSKPIYTENCPCAFDLLAAKPTCKCRRHGDTLDIRGGENADGSPFHTRWKDELENRFRYVFFSAHASARAQLWRKEQKISADATVWIHAPWIDGYWWDRTDDAASLDRLMDRRSPFDKDLTWQLNSIHPAAVHFYGVDLRFATHGDALGRISFVLRFGYDYSWWYHTLAAQESGEPWIMTFVRAARQLKALQGTKFSDPLDPTDGYEFVSMDREEYQANATWSKLYDLRRRVHRESFSADRWTALLTKE